MYLVIRNTISGPTLEIRVIVEKISKSDLDNISKPPDDMLSSPFRNIYHSMVVSMSSCGNIYYVFGTLEVATEATGIG